jgi:starch-binding outer membrane protein, SusD/RagB family
MKLFNKFLLSVCFILAFVSCEKKLTDLQPIDQIPGEKAISTMNDLTGAVNGVYATWSGRRSVYISTLISDEARLGTGTGYRNVGNALFNWQHVSDSQDWRDDETGGVWTNLYAVIDRANRVLEFMAPVPTANATEATLKAQYRGEMLAARAMAHLELLRCYSQTAEYTPNALGVVAQSAYSKSVASYRPARNTQAEVMALIDADLIAARVAIPATASNSNFSRITRNAVIGAQVRAALHIKNWQGVIDRANEVIPLQPLTSISSYSSLWATRSLPDTGAATFNTEVLWKLNVSLANLGSAIGSLFQDANGAVQASAAFKLTSTFNTVTDVRYSTFFRPGSVILIGKYGAVPPAGENFQYDIKMMRTSEIVLARAEAYAELSTPNIAASNADLSLLRTNRITGYVHVPIATKAALIDEILLERYKELCYEGQRYFDLRRKNLPISRDASDIGGIPTSQTLPVTDFHYILPIPNQERQANPNIVQNTGY